MKYIITESRLDKMIDKYITTVVGELIRYGNGWYRPDGECLFFDGGY